MENHDHGNDKLPANPEPVWDLLLHLDAYKCMVPNGIHPRILREMPDVIARSFSILFQWYWESGEVTVNWKLANVVPVFKKSKKKDPGIYRLVSFTSVPDKNYEEDFSGSYWKTLESTMKSLVITNTVSQGESPA